MRIIQEKRSRKSWKWCPWCPGSQDQRIDFSLTDPDRQVFCVTCVTCTLFSGKSFVRNVQRKRSRKMPSMWHKWHTSHVRLLKQPLLSFRHSPAHSGKRSPSQKFHQRTLEKPLYPESSQTGHHHCGTVARHAIPASLHASTGTGVGHARKFPDWILYEKFPTGLCLDNFESVIDKTGQLDTKYLFSGKSFVRNVQEKRSRKSR